MCHNLVWFGRRWRAALASCALALSPGFSGAQPAALAEPLAGPLAGVDAELVVSLDNLAAELARPAGRSLVSMLGELGGFERTVSAWRGLSGSLGLTPDEAMDRLLGGRVLLLADRAIGGGTEWAFVMEVDRVVGRALPRRLKASPRSSVDGHTLYAIEDGRFRVTNVEAGTRSLVAIAPVGGERLLRAGLAIASASVDAPRPAVADADRPVGTVVFRPGGTAWAAGRIVRAENGWSLGFHGVGLESGGRPLPISRAAFDRLAEDSLLAFAGRADGRAGVPGAALEFSLLSPQWAVWSLVPLTRPTEFLGGEAEAAYLSVRERGVGGIDCSMWFGVRDMARAARSGDAYVCRVLGELTTVYGPGRDAPECTGAWYGAPRGLAVTVENERPAFGGNLAFSWGPACAEGPGACGWWGMRVATVDGLSTLSPPEPLPLEGAGGFRGTMVQIRPAGLVAMVLGVGREAGRVPGPAEPAGPIIALRWVDTVRWEVGASSGGGTAGSVTIRMSMP